MKIGIGVVWAVVLSSVCFAERQEVDTRSELKVSMSKLSGDNEIEVFDMDLGDYRLLWYVYPVWEAESTREEGERSIPVKLEIATVLRFDEVTGVIEPWDDGPSPIASVNCSENGCGGVCCGFDSAKVVTESSADASPSEVKSSTSDSQDEVDPSMDDPSRISATKCMICTCCDSRGCKIVLNSCK